MREIDTLIHAAWIAPVEPPGTLLADHAVAIRDGRIEALLPTGAGRGRASTAKSEVTPRPARAHPGPGEPALPRGHDAAARPRRRPAAHDVAQGPRLAGGGEARGRRVRARRQPARDGRDAARRDHLLQRHVLLSRGDRARGAARRHAREPRRDRGRVPQRLRHRRGELPAQGPRDARRLPGRGPPLLLPGAARALHRERRDARERSRRSPRRSTLPIHTHLHETRGRDRAGPGAARHAPARAPAPPGARGPAPHRRARRAPRRGARSTSWRAKAPSSPTARRRT